MLLHQQREEATRPEGQIAGETQITGLARNMLAEKPSIVVPDNDPDRNIFYWKDLAAMTARANLPADAEVLSFFIDKSTPATEGGSVRRGTVLCRLNVDARQATLNGPKHLCIDREGNVLIADGRIAAVAPDLSPPADAEVNAPADKPAEALDLVGLAMRDLKKTVAEEVVAYLEPVREAYGDLRADENALEDVLAGGAEKARAIASRTLADVREAMALGRPG